MKFNNRDTAVEATLKGWNPPAPRAGFEDRIFDNAIGTRPLQTRTMMVGKIAASVVLMVAAASFALYSQHTEAPQVAEAPVEAPVQKVAKKAEPNLMAELPPVSPVPASMATDGLLPSVNIYTALEASAVLSLPDVLKTPSENAPIVPVKASADASQQ